MTLQTIINYKDIKTWDKVEITKKENQHLTKNSLYVDRAIFKVNQKINSKISIFYGELYKINTDAIVYSNTTSLSDRDGITDRIFLFGGQEMKSDIERNGYECRYGESIITRGGDLNCKHVVHTVCPTYNPKYLSAAENALNSCYRSSFHLAIENGAKTIAFSCLHTEKRSYPSVNGAHIGLRTIRRFLEKPYSNSIEKVVLVIDSVSNLEIYEEFLPLYFPRNTQEEIFSQHYLPENIGDENGESIEEDRKIRIIETPSSLIRDPDEDEDDCFYSVDMNDSKNNTNSNNTKSFLNSIENSKNTDQSYKYDPIDKILNPFAPGTSPIVTNNNSFLLKKEDPDIAKRKQITKKTEKQLENEKLQQEFQVLLEKSKIEDLSEISRLNFVLQTTDNNGYPLLVIIGSQLSSRKDLMERVLLHLIRTLEQIIQRGTFSLIYFHSNMSSQSSPDLSWLKKLLEIFELKYNNYLRAFNIVHPTFLLKTTLFISKSLLGDKGVLSKIVYHENMKLLSKSLSKCSLPKSIFNYEISNNQISDFSFAFDDQVSL
ncbi:hypothetical protein DICPUDRAFT_156819 [Dictyostelium purpureum]|uniref:Macro domain-containing protein n=1 Tax=Dictyostelium purpureum TaxID=5786 RepID=F0ZXI5_DICPU|nr:uncharacterized protein DICPUDRAFT_156819 [Dictyostelium purpureum]EGC31348.1 hypothetical protein DICPUDRAFT_156819 [Dictyostelium purpureum]|eukprot:XP_003292124.1 hypothetical protein DICPUDRAFT_156819 [Dictyostelium purpureum]